MAQYILDDEKIGGSNLYLRLLEDLRAAKDNPIFRTYVTNGLLGRKQRSYILSTTNEKVHLALGKLSRWGLLLMCELFEDQTILDAELVFAFEPSPGVPKPRNIFVTKSKSRDGDIIFHLAPGH